VVSFGQILLEDDTDTVVKIGLTKITTITIILEAAVDTSSNTTNVGVVTTKTVTITITPIITKTSIINHSNTINHSILTIFTMPITTTRVITLIGIIINHIIVMVIVVVIIINQTSIITVATTIIQPMGKTKMEDDNIITMAETHHPTLEEMVTCTTEDNGVAMEVMVVTEEAETKTHHVVEERTVWTTNRPLIDCDRNY